MAYDGKARHPQKHYADLPAFALTGAEPGREHLAISARQLAVEPRLRNLRRNHRRRLRRMAQTDRPATDDHLNRNARLGAYRSNIMTLGISLQVRARIFASRYI
jgi:hypothetical protein